MERHLSPSSEAQVALHGTEASFSFLRHVGPRFIHGAVCLSFDRATEFTFVSQAKWPPGENYDSAVSTAVQEVLAAPGSHLLNTRVLLKSIEWDPVNSSESGFQRAARAATLAALAV